METREPSHLLNICIVAHFAYDALTGNATGHIGGVEKQTSLMAHWFAGRGHRVSLITWDQGQPADTIIDDIRIIKLCKRNEGIPGLRFFHPRWTSLNQALHCSNADIYYQNCGEYVTGQVALWCQYRGKKFIYSAAADVDCDARLPLMKKLRERILYRLGVRYADRVIVQTRAQQHMLQQGFQKNSVLIPMPCPGPDERSFTPPRPPCRQSAPVLWVGRVCRDKRPDRFLDLAEACQDLSFDLVGPAEDSAYSRQVLKRARRIQNVTVHGAATPEQISRFYQHAACLCCTSDNEGFPNTFLEAWSHGLPVVSTLDPDCLITEKGMGAVATEVSELAAALRELFLSPHHWQTASKNARQYYLENHAVDRVLPRFEQVFLNSFA